MKIKFLNEKAISDNKLARLMNNLDLQLRQLQAKQNTKPEDLRDIALAMNAIQEISENPSLTDGDVTKYSGSKFQRLIREKELELRKEALKGNPDVHKLAEIFMTLKAMKSLASKEREISQPGSLKESLVFKEKDLALNIDDFKSGKSDRIFITGLSGSGKSTLARQITKTVKSVHVQMDDIAKKLKAEHGDEMFSNTLDPVFVSNKFIEEIEAEVKNNKGKLVIFEGVQVQKIDFDYLKNYPVYSLNTPLIRSFVMAQSRMAKKGEPLRTKPLYNFKENLKREKRMKVFNEKMRNEGAVKYSIEELLGVDEKQYAEMIQEMSVAGIAPLDGTSQGPMIWQRDNVPGIRLASPFKNKKKKKKVDIKESEVRDDLRNMYGDFLDMSDEDRLAYEEARNYVLNESPDSESKKEAEKVIKAYSEGGWRKALSLIADIGITGIAGVYGLAMFGLATWGGPITLASIGVGLLTFLLIGTYGELIKALLLGTDDLVRKNPKMRKLFELANNDRDIKKTISKIKKELEESKPDKGEVKKLKKELESRIRELDRAKRNVDLKESQINEAMSGSKMARIAMRLEREVRRENQKNNPDTEKLKNLYLELKAVKNFVNPEESDGKVKATTKNPEPPKVKVSRKPKGYFKESENISEAVFKISFLTGENSSKEETVEADSEDEAIRKAIDEFKVDVMNISSVEKKKNT
jgi:tRNA uridine 5-carbamoylmethylation protein Kti12